MGTDMYRELLEDEQKEKEHCRWPVDIEKTSPLQPSILE
jgi:hypothetical protein